jgi:myo-inositol catabolism protein IolS
MSAAIENITIGQSDLTVARLGFGCWQLGGHGWQGIDPQAIRSAIEEALARGITLFDTADIYGLGESEERLGEILDGRGIVASKFGVRRRDGKTWFDNSSAWIHEAIEASLRRLKRETIDLYQMHWHDGHRPIDDILDDLERLRQQGKIRWYGLCNVSPSLIGHIPPGLVSFSLEYSLLRRQHEHAILAVPPRFSCLAWGALAQGLLSGRYKRGDYFEAGDVRSRAGGLFDEANWDFYEPLLAEMSRIAKVQKRTMTQIALRWLLDVLPGSLALVGIKNGAQLSDNIGALGWYLPDDIRRTLDHLSPKPSS